MDNKKEPSRLSLLNGKMSFTDEPHWYRLLVILIVAIFLLCLFWIIKVWAVPTIAASHISGVNIFDVIKSSKNQLLSE